MNRLIHTDSTRSITHTHTHTQDEMPFIKAFSDNIRCRRCEGRYVGGFDPVKKEIVICENHNLSKSEIRTTVKHECVHAKDDSNGIDWKDPKQRARSEVRAARFSGECELYAELRRWPISRWYEMYKSRGDQGDRSCVRRRATASVRMALDDCGEPGKGQDAKSIVDAEFEDAYNDQVVS